MAKARPANRPKTGKRGGKTRTSWKPGQSGNPKGAPKRGESWAEILTEISSLTPAAAMAKSKQIAGVLGDHKGSKVTLKELVAIRMFTSLIFEPSAGMANAVMDRMEGKVPFAVDLNWRAEVERRGLDASAIFEAMVQAAAAQLDSASGGGSMGGSGEES